jgi:hypothetical protein
MTNEPNSAAEKLAGLCSSKVKRWNEAEKKATSADPNLMDAAELRRQVFDLHDLLSHAVADIRFLAGYLRSGAEPRVVH